MEVTKIDSSKASKLASEENNLLVVASLTAASNGDISAFFDLGVAYSTGSNGLSADLIEAHKWFNIAASRGHDEASWCRSDVSEEMTAREIAEAQRRARQWLAIERRNVA